MCSLFPLLAVVQLRFQVRLGRDSRSEFFNRRKQRSQRKAAGALNVFSASSACSCSIATSNTCWSRQSQRVFQQEEAEVAEKSRRCVECVLCFLCLLLFNCVFEHVLVAPVAANFSTGGSRGRREKPQVRLRCSLFPLLAPV